MDQVNSDADMPLSPSKILEKLQILRQLQIMQRGKLHKQTLQYQNTSDASSNITEMISHFTNSFSSTSYNTFRSSLISPQNETLEDSPRPSISQKVKENDLIEGVCVLNLSKESEFIISSPISSRSRSVNSAKITPNASTDNNQSNGPKKQISLDEMPILSPKTDFETLVIENLKKDNNSDIPKSKNLNPPHGKKPFLKRGEGMARFGVRKKDLVIQNTKSLPWKKKYGNNNNNTNPHKPLKTAKENVDIQIVINEPNLKLSRKNENKPNEMNDNKQIEKNTEKCVKISSKSPDIAITNQSDSKDNNQSQDSPTFKAPETIIQYPKGKHPVQANKGKTWASVLTKEQNDLLAQLKQSDYYKNFVSPSKSTISEVSCDEDFSRLSQDREQAEQNLFDLLENKVTNESFSMESPFFNKLLKRTKLDYSGESTPLIMQKCLASNPNLMHIFPNFNHRRKQESYTDAETCQSEYTECCSDTCSSVSSCCSCETLEPSTPHNLQNKTSNKEPRVRKEVAKQDDNKNKVTNVKETQNVMSKEEEEMKANMVEANEKLIITSELLKERLKELEDEIKTFRQENITLNKMKEEVDVERQKFYEEKKTFEQKFNEEKILSEYYLAEEKEKLNKQKQMYERYVREMRGRLNKKEKDEVVNLKQEINNLKEEIRLKDAKSTSTIARLRNQLKLMEKEKADLQAEVEKLRKENRRIQHSNDITRRLSNLKYLQEINKKLNNMGKDNPVAVEVNNDIKYKAFEIERQSRSRKQVQHTKNTIRPRAKSVPNLNVTSKYAKYFSQRDTASQIEKNKNIIDHYSPRYESDEDIVENIDLGPSYDNKDMGDERNSSDDQENNLEKIYLETFRSNSPASNRSSLSNSNESTIREHSSRSQHSEDYSSNTNAFFLRKSNSSSSTRDSKSPTTTMKSPYLHDNESNRSKSPVSILSNRSKQKSPIVVEAIIESNKSYRSKSTNSVHSNHSSQHLTTVIHKDLMQDNLLNVSPEPTTSKTSLTKTNLNPTEIRKSDGSRELRFPNGNVKYISADGKYTKFIYYNGDVKENFLKEGRIKYFYAETKTYHTTHADGLEVIEFPDGRVEKRYKDGSSEIRLPNGTIRYHDPKNKHVREEWRFPDGASLTVSANGEQRIVFSNGQIEVHEKEHKRREYPDGTVKLVYNDGTSETRYASGRVRIKDKHGNLIMDSALGQNYT